MSSPIFISYSHKDEKWLTELQNYLGPTIKDLYGVPWSDLQIKPGEEWQGEIEVALASAKVAILLVTQNFIASEFISNNELPPILAAAEQGRMKVFWILVMPCTYERTGLVKYQATRDPMKPLAELRPFERARFLTDICKKIADELKTVYANGAPTKPDHGDNETKTRSAREGIEALIELMKIPAVQGHVATFKVVFGLSSRQIEILGYYKALHDLLHTFQISCYDKLTNIARRSSYNPDDPTLWDDGFDYEGPLLDAVVTLKQVSKQQETLGRDSVSWVATMGGSLRTLSTAVEKKNVKEVNTAIRPVQRVMSLEPIILNDRLVEAASRLPLTELADNLSGICERIDRSQVNRVALLQSGVTALRDLDLSLTHLIDKHRMWQEIDREIRRVEGSVFNDVGAVVASWPDLKQMTEAQCADLDEDMANLLGKTMGRLDQAIMTWVRLSRPADETRGIQETFLNYRNVANKCFYKVDVDLKDLCEKLQRVGEPLAKVWEVVQ